jgi:hypothetical protein
MRYNKLFDIEDGFISVRMLDSWGIATNYKVESVCPVCGSNLVNNGKVRGRWDGVHTYIHDIGCIRDCSFSHKDIKRINRIKD